MRVPARWLPAVSLTAALTLAACGGPAGEQQTGEAAPAPSPSASHGGGHTAGPKAQDDAVEIEVEIENGEVTPSGERVDVEVGQTVRFVVTSDAADEIHVHSTPEHTFRFRAGTRDRAFGFEVRQPGVIEAELHELGDVVVTIAARP